MENEDALLFDFPSHRDVERPCILGLLLVLQRDGEVLAGFDREAVNVLIRTSSELGQAGRARCSERDKRLLNALSQLDGFDRFPGL